MKAKFKKAKVVLKISPIDAKTLILAIRKLDRDIPTIQVPHILQELHDLLQRDIS